MFNKIALLLTSSLLLNFTPLASHFVSYDTVTGEISLNRVYSNTMEVIDVVNLGDDTQLIELEDYNGNVWEYETDSTDLLVDDCVSVTMDNMGTDIIYDDEIIGLRYNAWILNRAVDSKR